jgi:hypothetical protein
MATATKIQNLIEARMTGSTREVLVPDFVIKHIDEVMDQNAETALTDHPGDTEEARYARVAYYFDRFIEGVAANMRGQATKQFVQVMACYIRNGQPQSYTIDSSGCVNPAAA